MQKIENKKTGYDMRPYERFKKFGVESLSDSELLSIIIRTGTYGESAEKLANRLVYENKYGSLLGIFHLTANELKEIKGIGEIKAMQIMCIAELSKRISKSKAEIRLNFSNPKSIAKLYMEELRHKETEQVVLLLLDTKLSLIREIFLTKGTVNYSVLSSREVFLTALKFNAVNFVLLHNHPSGDPTPSIQDINITKKIGYVGDLLGITLIDHIIIGDNSFYSMKDKGLFDLT